MADRTDASLRWERAEKLLCVRLDSIGDVLMTTPAIRALKESGAGRSITVLTSSVGAAIAGLVPEIDDVIVYDAPWMKSSAGVGDADLAVIDQLRGRFDAAAIFTVYSQSPLPAAYLCQLAGIPLRLAHCRENPYQLLTDWLREPEPQDIVRHEVRRQLDLVAAVGASTDDDQLSLSVPEDAFRAANATLAEFRIDQTRPWTVVHPGATASSRRYPPESFATVCRTLALEDAWQIVIVGDDSEMEIVEQIQREMGAPSVWLRRLKLAELCAVLARAPLVIGNNSGPVHIAAAVGTPVVDLYALTNPQHEPWGVPKRVLSHDVPCKYCYSSVCREIHHDCLRLITPEQVAAAARELLDETNTAHPGWRRRYEARCSDSDVPAAGGTRGHAHEPDVARLS
jgi:lipopolysaccharide heptosyltransferase II